jgi:hypothetical protein
MSIAFGFGETRGNWSYVEKGYRLIHFWKFYLVLDFKKNK